MKSTPKPAYDEIIASETRWMKMARGLLVFILLLVLTVIVADHAYAGPNSGLYWNPAESGRGYAIDNQNGILAVTTYIYDGNGNAIWYLAAGPMDASETLFVATANEFAGGQCLGCPHENPDVVGNAGVMRLEFSDPDNALLIWQGEMIPIERQNFGFGNAPRSMLGRWAFVVEDSFGGPDHYTTYSYTFDQTGPPSGVEGGTGVFLDLAQFTVGECFDSGPRAGLCLVIEFREDQLVVRRFIFEQNLDRLVGERLTFNSLATVPMVGIQMESAKQVLGAPRSAGSAWLRSAFSDSVSG